METVKPMSIKEDYMSKPQVIPATVNKMGRKTTLPGTCEPVPERLLATGK